MAQCGACGKMVKAGAVCPSCSSISHYLCVNLPRGVKVADTWRCGACQASAPKGRDPSTPVRSAQENYVVQEVPTAALEDTAEFTEAEQQLMHTLREDMRAEFSGMHGQLVKEINSFKTDFNIMFSEFREFRTEMAELRASVSGMAQRMDGIERRLEVVERSRAEPAPAGAEVGALERAVAELKQELNDRDQDALLADLEIGNLPEVRGESALHAITVLAAKLGVAVEERDVVFAERVGAVRGEGSESAAPPRARRVVVRFARRDLRDRLLQGARVRRTLTAADAGHDAAGATSRIYVNERLTRTNRQLFYHVREECRRAQWKFSWSKRGRVYAREAEGKPAYPIRTEADLTRVFGSARVQSDS